MRIMTFNIRFDNPADDAYGWDYRRDLVCSVIKRYDPCIIGTQEGKWHQLVYLRDHLSGYSIHAPQRIIDESSQYPTLFYSSDQFESIEGADRWLSRTPLVHRSSDWNSTFPRMMSWGRIIRRHDQRDLRVAVTHLDHANPDARLQQASLLADFVKQWNGPSIVMGDFNDHPGSPVHQLLTSRGTGLHDTWQALGRPENEESMTHHGFQGIPQKTRMDWILVSRHFEIRDAMIIRDHWQGSYPSDHYPYVVEAECA